MSGPAITLNGTGDLLAGIPGLLGFRPQDDLVMIGVDRRNRVTLAARVGLDDVMADPEQVISQMAEAAKHSGAVSWFGVAYTTDPARSGRARQVADSVSSLAGCGRARDCVIAPAVTPVPAIEERFTRSGATIADSRADKASQVAPGPVTASNADVDELVGRFADLAPDVRCARLERIIDRVEHTVGDPALADCAALAALTRDKPLRDWAWCMAEPDDAARLKTMWAGVCRELPDPSALPVLQITTHVAYLSGDGAMAWDALRRAEAISPGDPLNALYARALHTGLRPEQLFTRERLAGMRDAVAADLAPEAALGPAWAMSAAQAGVTLSR